MTAAIPCSAPSPRRPRPRPWPWPAGGSAIEVAVSPDDRFAFVTLEYSAEIAVFDLNRALTRGFGPSDFVGHDPGRGSHGGDDGIAGWPVAVRDKRSGTRGAAGPRAKGAGHA